MTSNGKRKFVPRDQVSRLQCTCLFLFIISTHKYVVSRNFLSILIVLSSFILLILYFSTWIWRLPYTWSSLNTHRRKREAVYKHSIATDFFYFSILVEILGYNEDPETRQDAKELEWGYIRNEREEFCKCDEFCKSLVFRLRWSLIYSLFKTVAQLQTSWIIEQFFYAFCVTFKRTRTASHQVLQHTTQYAFLWLNQQARKTSLKNTNIGDIKHKWEYFQSLEPF